MITKMSVCQAGILLAPYSTWQWLYPSNSLCRQASTEHRGRLYWDTSIRTRDRSWFILIKPA